MGQSVAWFYKGQLRLHRNWKQEYLGCDSPSWGKPTMPTADQIWKDPALLSLGVPSVRLDTVGSKAFLVAAPRICNSLLNDIISSVNLSSFCHQLKTFLFSFAFFDLIL